MTAKTVLEVPPELQDTNFRLSIVRIYHRPDATVYYGSHVPVVTQQDGAEQLGMCLGTKPLFGNLFEFTILYQGVVCLGEDDAIQNAGVPTCDVRSDGLVACGAGRVYINPELLKSLPPLR